MGQTDFCSFCLRCALACLKDKRCSKQTPSLDSYALLISWAVSPRFIGKDASVRGRRRSARAEASGAQRGQGSSQTGPPHGGGHAEEGAFPQRAMLARAMLMARRLAERHSRGNFCEIEERSCAIKSAKAAAAATTKKSSKPLQKKARSVKHVTFNPVVEESA
eukprot:6183748-Pleurochrysis_carterae.AAC.1